MIKELIKNIKKHVSKRKNIYVSIICALCIAASGVINYNESLPTVGTENGIPVPIIMYHSVLKSAKKQTKYIVTPSQLESDLLWLKNNGYTTVFIGDLINYVYNNVDLPEKPVVITFDDGYYNNLTYLYPLLTKYNMKASISLVGSYSEEFSKTMDLNPAYAHLTWDNVKQMQESGLVEFLNHSYNMHSNDVRKGSSIIKGEDKDKYKALFTSDVMKLQELLSLNCGITPQAYTYPFGYICSEAESILKELGFLATLSCYEKVNYITKDPNCLYQLRRFNRSSTLSTEGFMKKIVE